MKNLPILIKISLAFAIVLSIFAALAFYQQSSLLTLEKLEKELVKRSRDTIAVGDIDSRLEHFYAEASRLEKGASLSEIRGLFSKAEKDMKTISMLVDTPSEKQQQKNFSKAYKLMIAAIQNDLIPSLSSSPEEVINIKRNIYSLVEEAMGNLDSIKASLEKEMKSSSASFDENMAQIKQASIIANVCGILAAIGFALLTAISIGRPLKRAAVFAQNLAEGRIDSDLDIDQKDEVGQVAHSIKNISESLTKLLSQNRTAIRKVQAGDLRFKSPSDSFSGAFADLVENSNRMAETYLNYLDEVSSPLMTIDTDYNVLFLNKAGAATGGKKPEQVQGSKCMDFFRTSDCKTKNCACFKAMRDYKESHSETDAHPDGMDLEISYTGKPIYDHEGKLAGAFESIVDLTDIKQAQRRMQKTAENASNISNRLASAAEEISAQVEQASSGAEVQRERTTETATAMEEMNSTVVEVARNASNASENADQTKQQAHTGSETIKRMISAMTRVQEAADTLNKNMVELDSQASGIGEIMNVINDIADQTNLLALNAAIEAARAGEAGRGFAVVADEVRKLAEKTMDATNEVGVSIKNIQNGTSSSLESTEQAVSAIKESTGLANDSGQVLEEIVGYAEDTADQVRAIATSAEEQSAVSEQINKSTEEVNRISAETADSMAQSSQAVHELASLASELQSSIEELSTSS